MALSVVWVLPVRAIQAVFALIVLGLTAYVVSWYDDLAYNGYGSPGPVNFMLFNGVWTLFIAVPYLVLAPRHFARFTHPYVELAVETVTMIFWFAGFIALAAFLPTPHYCHGSVCDSLQAATVFGAFEWALFAATFAVTLMAVLNNSRNNRDSTTINKPGQTTVHAGV